MTNREKLLNTLNENITDSELCEIAEMYILCENCPAKSYCNANSSGGYCSKLLKQWIEEDEEKK